jgi:hypothetical protein
MAHPEGAPRLISVPDDDYEFLHLAAASALR